MRDSPLVVAVCVCTYRRNDALARALDGVERSLSRLQEVRDCRGVVVIVDDNPSGDAEPVARAFAARTSRSTEYRQSGRRNISDARNLALDTGFGLADHVALLDDDSIPTDEWLVEAFNVMHETEADVVSGPTRRTAPLDGPPWLLNPPVRPAATEPEDRAALTTASTANALLRTSWFASNPIRFDPRFGEVGGEDMVFFGLVARAGADIRYARHAVIHEPLPPDRATFRYQLYAWTWSGNTEAITTIENGTTSRVRLAARAGRRAGRAVVLLAKRVVAGERHALAYFVFHIGSAVGLAAGTAGLRLRHR